MADEDQYLRYHEFDRVESLRGRPRHTGPFAPDPSAPRSTAPLATPSSTISTLRESGLAPSIRRAPSQWEGEDLTNDDDEFAEAPSQLSTIVVASGSSENSRGRGRGGRGGRGRDKGGRGRGTRQAQAPRSRSAAAPRASRGRCSSAPRRTSGGITRRTSSRLSAQRGTW